MILILSVYLGMCFANAGMFAKLINSGAGLSISNRGWHGYLTTLGALSNLVLPVIAVIGALIVGGISAGAIFVVGMLLGAFVCGLLNLPYGIKLLFALLGLPLFLIILMLGV